MNTPSNSTPLNPPPTSPKPPSTPQQRTHELQTHPTHQSNYKSLRTKSSCCACKHQRRRCTPDCPLAPYFPPEKSSDFRNVHKLFGIHNVVNLLRKIPPKYRSDAVQSLCYEANTRAKYPVGGCFFVILELQRMIIQAASELEVVNKQLLRLYDDQVQEKNNQDWEKMFLKDSEEGFDTCHQFWNDLPNDQLN